MTARASAANPLGLTACLGGQPPARAWGAFIRSSCESAGFGTRLNLCTPRAVNALIGSFYASYLAGTAIPRDWPQRAVALVFDGVGCANCGRGREPACFAAGSIVEPDVGVGTFDVGGRDVILARARLQLIAGLMAARHECRRRARRRGAPRTRSRRLSVLVDQSAEQVVPTDRRRVGSVIDSATIAAVWWGELERAVRPVPVEVAGVYAQDVLEMPPSKDQDAIETVAADGAPPSAQRTRSRSALGTASRSPRSPPSERPRRKHD